MTYDQFKALRAALADDVGDQYAGDPSRRSKIGSDQFKKDVAARQKAGGVGLDGDMPGLKLAGLNRTGAFAAIAVLQGLASAFASGRELGTAAGALVTGLTHAFAGAASGFVHIGEGVLSALLSPLGKSGGVAAKLAGGLGEALVSGLSAGGAVLSAGVKVGVGLVSGIVAGLATLTSIGAGALLGGFLGSILPGGGTIAGALIGGGIGGTIAGAVLSALAGIAGSVSSALGSALGAIGDAFGKVGEAIGSALSSVKDVLSDLIETGVRLSQVTLQTQRNSGMSLGASSASTALSQVLTGGPGAFSGLFANVAMMTPYMRARNEAYGVHGNSSFVDNLPGLYQRYKAFGGGPAGALERRIMLSVVAPGAQDTIGGLFSLGGRAVSRAAQIARQTALSPREVQQNAMLGFDLNGIQAQLDRLKTKLLSDLMPAIQGVLGVFTAWFTGHEGQIVSGLEAFGKWLYVRLPTYLQMGANAFFELGKSLASALPAIAQFGKSVYSGFATLFNAIKTGLGALLTTFGVGLAAVGVLMSATPLGRGMMAAGGGLAKAGWAMGMSPNLDPHKADAFFDKMAAMSPGLTQSIQSAQDRTNKFLGGAFGTEAERARDWQKLGPGAPSSGGQNAFTLNADITVHPDEDSFHRFSVRVGDQTIKRIVRADQRS